jgi:hypothetical protein
MDTSQGDNMSGQTPKMRDGWYAVRIMSALLAVVECGAAVVLANQAKVTTALALPGWMSVAVTATAIGIAILVGITVAICSVGRRHYINV